MDSHADTCCAGANWKVEHFTGQVCEVAPFLSQYDPVQEIPIARCSTVWTSPYTGKEFLLVADEVLWFGTSLPHTLLNPNQILAYGLQLNDNPFTQSDDFGISLDEEFIPFDTTGTIVHFESRVPTEWERLNLPIIVLTDDSPWNPSRVVMERGKPTREMAEMRTIRSLTTGREQDLSRRSAAIERNGEVERTFGQISGIINPRTFCERIASSFIVGPDGLWLWLLNVEDACGLNPQ